LSGHFFQRSLFALAQCFGVVITSHTPKYSEPAKIQANLSSVAQQY